MSLGDSTRSEEAWIFPDCLENGYVCMGFGDGIDFAGCDTLPGWLIPGSEREVKDTYASQAVH